VAWLKMRATVAHLAIETPHFARAAETLKRSCACRRGLTAHAATKFQRGYFVQHLPNARAAALAFTQQQNVRAVAGWRR
jgi:hypothetical protein